MAEAVAGQDSLRASPDTFIDRCTPRSVHSTSSPFLFSPDDPRVFWLLEHCCIRQPAGQPVGQPVGWGNQALCGELGSVFHRFLGLPASPPFMCAIARLSLVHVKDRSSNGALADLIQPFWGSPVVQTSCRPCWVRQDESRSVQWSHPRAIVRLHVSTAASMPSSSPQSPDVASGRLSRKWSPSQSVPGACLRAAAPR